MSRHFRVVYESDDGGWHAYIPEVKGCRTWGRTLATARTNIREALSLCDDEIPNAEKVAASAVFDDDVKLPADASRALVEHQEAVAAWKALGVKLKAANVKAARALTGKISLRDAGELLGLSHGRVKQLVDESAPRRAKKGARAASKRAQS